MPKTVKERIEDVAETLGTIYQGIVFATAIVHLISHEYDEQEEKMVGHLEDAKMHIGLVEAELLALAAMVEDGRPPTD
ncbi:hypothetical protein ES708_33337 [subsurface metagenome]